MKAVSILLIVLGLSSAGFSQSASNRDAASGQTVKKHKTKVKRRTGPGREAANGSGDIAKGVGKGAGDVATLHPVRGAGDLGKGAGEGTYKVGRGIGGGIAKIFHHPHHQNDR